MANNKTKSKSSTSAPKNSPVVPEGEVVPAEGVVEELPRDILDDFMFNAANYIYVRRKMFIAIGIAIAVVLAAVYSGWRYLEYRENVRNEKLFQIETIIHEQSVSDSAVMEKAMPLLNDFVQLYEGSGQYWIALLYRGEVNFRSKRYDEAAADLEIVIGSDDATQDLKVLATLFLSNVLRNQSKIDQAIQVLTSISSEKLGDTILMELAEAYSSAGKTAEAKRTLEALLKDYPNSGYTNRAKELMGMM